MGVRAVVAAGWAVRDDAALVFAEKFYDEMLNGATFGRALMEARIATWRRFPDSNTWGAYQAYGDPDFRLVLKGSAARSHGQVAHEELLEQIDRIWKHARTIDVQETYGADKDATAKGKSDQLRHLEALLADVPQAWLDRSDVRIAVAEAFGELGGYPKAIEHYRFALDTGELDSKTTIKAAEQLFNLTARQAEVDKDPKRLRDAITRLKAMQGVGATSERFNLLGSAYKGMAKIARTPASVRKAVEDAARFYGESARHNTERGSFDHYPVVNRVALLAVLGKAPKDWAEQLNESALNAHERFQKYRGTKDAVYHAIAPADIAVVRALSDKTLSSAGAKRTAAINEIVGQYQQTLSAVQATPRQVDSVVRQIKTLAAFIDKLGGAKLAGAEKLRRDALTEIADALG
jgi:tetratricopeptide repeat protein/CHAT domain-containing protein